MPAPKRYRVAIPAYVFVTVEADNQRDARDAARMFASAYRDVVHKAESDKQDARTWFRYGVERDSAAWGFKRGGAPSVESRL